MKNGQTCSWALITASLYPSCAGHLFICLFICLFVGSKRNIFREFLMKEKRTQTEKKRWCAENRIRAPVCVCCFSINGNLGRITSLKELFHFLIDRVIAGFDTGELSFAFGAAMNLSGDRREDKDPEINSKTNSRMIKLSWRANNILYMHSSSDSAPKWHGKNPQIWTLKEFVESDTTLPSASYGSN